MISSFRAMALGSPTRGGPFALLMGVIAAVCNMATAEDGSPPPIAREFRAAWVATVANIDWPSQPGLSSEGQQAELISILDRAAELNLNAIVFQVRPHCDALYASNLEPWSEYLTGRMGQEPEPFYDPLELAVTEAHERGIELHAWFNPYRASHPAMKGELASSHISRIRPKVVKEYGKYLWLDPGESGAVEHSLAVILDVVRRYDVDGVHFDDYFYPYPINDENGKRKPFPDDASWESRERDSQLTRSDWRRQNVDSFVQRVHDEVKKAKPWVQFGISPFGIWRPGNPESIKGFDAYENLYADAKKWFQKGWVDYLTPQLYWTIESKGQSYPVLLQWWHEQNKLNRHLWPGNFASRVANESSGNWKAEEILNQIEVTRDQKGAGGNVHFSMKALMDDRGLADALAAGPYREPALVPASPWMGESAPGRPLLKFFNGDLHFEMEDGTVPWLWTMQLKRGGQWDSFVLPGKTTHYCTPGSEENSPIESIAVSAVNRAGMTGPTEILAIEE